MKLLRAFSPDILKAAQTAAFGLYEEESARPGVQENVRALAQFREDINLWHRVAEQTYSTFAAADKAKRKNRPAAGWKKPAFRGLFLLLAQQHDAGERPWASAACCQQFPAQRMQHFLLRDDHEKFLLDTSQGAIRLTWYCAASSSCTISGAANTPMPPAPKVFSSALSSNSPAILA